MTEPSPTGPVEMPQVALSGPGPSTLADLYSQARDLAFAAACMKECLISAASSEETLRAAAPAPQALFNAGLISYRRAFASGRAHLMPKKSRFSLAESFLQVLTPEQRAMHEEMLKTANEHVAHRVGDGEGAMVIAFLAPPPQNRELVALGSVALHFMGPTEQFARDAVALCEFAYQTLQGGIEARSDALLTTLRETADLDRLYADSITHGNNSSTK